MSQSLAVSPRILVPLAILGALFLALAILGKVPLRYNVRNLLVRWKVTLMTALAFTLVVGLMVVMLAFVNGMYKLTEGSGRPENVLVLADGATDEVFSNLGGLGDIKEIALRPAVQPDGEGRLASWEIYVVGNQPLVNPKPGGPRRRFVQIRGIEDPVRAGRVHDLVLHPGGVWFNPDAGADKEGAIHGVLGEGIAREMGKDIGKASLEPGDRFELGGRPWVVTGIMQSAGSTFDSEVWGKLALVGEIYRKSITTVVLRTRDATAAEELADDLNTNYKKPAVKAQTETAYYASLSATNLQFLVAIIIVAVIMALGGMFGIMNTMFAAISQRTKDIGVLRIIGYARWQLLVSFFLEAMFLALVGGLLGCALGSLANGMTATSIVGSGQGYGKSVVLKLVVDANILLTGLLLSLSMGFLGGLLPALSAMRLRPLESLR